MKTIRKYFSDLREYREAVITGQAAILAAVREGNDRLDKISRGVGKLIAREADTLNRVTAAAESLTEMQRAVLAQSHPHLVR